MKLCQGGLVLYVCRDDKWTGCDYVAVMINYRGVCCSSESACGAINCPGWAWHCSIHQLMYFYFWMLLEEINFDIDREEGC